MLSMAHHGQSRSVNVTQYSPEQQLDPQQTPVVCDGQGGARLDWLATWLGHPQRCCASDMGLDAHSCSEWQLAQHVTKLFNKARKHQQLLTQQKSHLVRAFHK